MSDPENRLIGFVERVSAGGAITKTVDYAYDPAGRRIRKDVDGVVTSFIYDALDILLEYDGSNALVARFTHGLGIDNHLIMERGGQTNHYHADGLGSVTEISDSAGAVVQAYLFDSYGNITQQSGTIINPYTFTGREVDAESGLYYFRARYYDGKSGRFLQEDPIGFAGLDINNYRYGSSNPVNYKDLTGYTSYRVSRPLNIWPLSIFASHEFIVTNAKYIGDPNATVHSFGKNNRGDTGSVDDKTKGFSKDTNPEDKIFWLSLGKRNRSSGACPLNGSKNPNVTFIPTTDSIINNLAENLIEDHTYIIGGHSGVNSNSAAHAISNTPFGTEIPASDVNRISPGAGNWRMLRFGSK